MAYTIFIEPEAIDDIQEGIDWYNEQQPGLGRKFHEEVKAAFERLQETPFFQVRYDNVRCLSLHKFPYMVHFTLDETQQMVIVRAVFNTSIDPNEWTKR